MTQMQWWGYLHDQGTLQAKRFFDYGDIEEANSSPFVKRTFGPFMATGREDALNKIKKKIEDQNS